jgi:uncharacterized cupredoxin-like copper-binding protein
METKEKTMKALLLAIGTMLALSAHPHGEQSTHTDRAVAQETPFGRAADPKKARRTVRVAMTDEMRFDPGEVTVKRGDIVRFVALNKGQVMHEMVLGRMEDPKAHAAAMRKHPGMAHDEPYMAHVAPGKSGEIGWQFSQAGEFYYACLVPGHLEAGMLGKVNVAP